jgi:hypothetical protein
MGGMMEILATILASIGAMLWLLTVAAGVLIELLQDERRMIPYGELVAAGKVGPPGTRRTG